MNDKNMIKRFPGIDALKFICAFFVVCIHKRFPGMVGLYIVAISRIAVPIYFMITGFFYKSEENQEKKQILKLLKIILFSSVLYFVWNFMLDIAGFIVHGNTDSIFRVLDAFSKRSLLEMFLFNESPFAGHLWYLNAVVYVFLCFFILKKIKLVKILYWITPLLLIVDLVFGKYSLAILGREFDYICVRNFLFVGIPYFAIGHVIRHAYVQNKLKPRHGKYLLVAATVFSIMLCVIEKYILLALKIEAKRDHYISTTVLAIVVFILFLTAFSNENKKLKWISDIGRKNSLDIYIIHPMVMDVLSIISRKLRIENAYVYVAPGLVFAVSIFLSVIYRRVLNCFKNKCNKNN